jgi:hypothetical protein
MRLAAMINASEAVLSSTQGMQLAIIVLIANLKLVGNPAAH